MALSIAGASPLALAADVELTIDAAQAGPLINKHIYGQFAEHLGTGIYEGMWVGPKAKTPNTHGWRNDVLGALKALHVPLIRWPGGCFADEYHWRDGIGPRAKRPVKVNTNWGGVEESNAVGTHEFFDLVELLGADAYVNGNLGTGSTQEMAEWLEYMTADGKSTLAQARRANGHAEPFKLSYFAVGNEAWGCGGSMTPEHYADLYKTAVTFLKAPDSRRPKFLASGGNDADTRWTEVLSHDIKSNIDAISFHYYTLPTGKWETKGAATGFAEDQWINTLAQTLKMEPFIAQNVAVLDKNDPQKKIGFAVDEWGTWYDVEPGTNPGFLYQQNTLRDAVVAALNFNIFHAHADRVRMSNIAQMVNVLQAMILTDKDKMLLTPTYHAYAMYVPFQDATSLPLSIANNPAYSLGGTSIPGLSASAARSKDGKLYLALVNSNPHVPLNVAVRVKGETATAAHGQVLTADAMDARNTFQAPQQVQPRAFDAKTSGATGPLTLSIPAKAVVVVAVER
ncbi:alpha-N-arabinofuranosidase [Roseateles koreensis]|uniref:non-reducing end alpha-L-arabinofuranosidase n=1 Tax=Roseateles koreensis TaxID=2987526 RepID=A0ABT5KU81_9BURK|nr:alpha-L-arabinofuranosidase C-terminal domain-containing protein [Roseateles koreensis]MDC8786491.1 alpha-L-arabinofuranosidase C-terminal domain-containing protein [Roseateles koreensis]